MWPPRSEGMGWAWFRHAGLSLRLAGIGVMGPAAAACIPRGPFAVPADQDLFEVLVRGVRVGRWPRERELVRLDLDCFGV